MKGKPKEGRHPNFKTGITKASNGYLMIFVGKHHHLADCRGYAYVHRLNWEKANGRRLKLGEIVHHDDENKLNNEPYNLILKINNSIHRHEHAKRLSKHPDEINITIQCACGCGLTLLKYDSVNRPRQYIVGHNIKHKYGS